MPHRRLEPSTLQRGGERQRANNRPQNTATPCPKWGPTRTSRRSCGMSVLCGTVEVRSASSPLATYDEAAYLGGPAGTVGSLGHIAPLSQNNSQSSECVDPNFGTVAAGTKAVGTNQVLGQRDLASSLRVA